MICGCIFSCVSLRQDEVVKVSQEDDPGTPEPAKASLTIYKLQKPAISNMKITLLRVIPTMTFIHFLTGKSSGILSDISSDILFDILSGISSGI